MKIKDIKIGMKVVPTKKSLLHSLDKSVVWKRAQEVGQKFLYVTEKIFNREGKPYFLLSNIRGDRLDSGEPNGDYFLATDFKKFS